MRLKSYYTVLGISDRASPERIRAAYLRLVKQLHPDHAGEASSHAFREVQQAYDVLSDPVRRRGYDRQLHPELHLRTRRPDPPPSHRFVEPLNPDWPSVVRGRPGSCQRLRRGPRRRSCRPATVLAETTVPWISFL